MFAASLPSWSRSAGALEDCAAPLTHVSAQTPSGIESTLAVRVNEVRWREAKSLFGLEPTDHLYTTRTDAEGRTVVIFGDGKRGARLPTGAENVRAVYRVGIGRPGNLGASRISQLVTRPLGVKDVKVTATAPYGSGRGGAKATAKAPPREQFVKLFGTQEPDSTPVDYTHGIPQAKLIRDTFDANDVAVIGLHSVFEHHDVMTRRALEVFVHEYRIQFPVALDMPSSNAMTMSRRRACSLRSRRADWLSDSETDFELPGIRRPPMAAICCSFSFRARSRVFRPSPLNSRMPGVQSGGTSQTTFGPMWYELSLSSSLPGA